MRSCQPLSRLRVASLCVAITLAACAPNPEAFDARYAGPVDPCTVIDKAPPTPVDVQFDDRPLWHRGPFPVWNSHPDTECNANPKLQTDGDRAWVDGSEVYLTYPVSEDPTRTGRVHIPDERFPVVIFAHANNDTRCQIFEDYWSLHDHWASWGFIVAAVDGTRFNCSPGTQDNIRGRRDGQLEALDLLWRLDESAGPLAGHIDHDRVFFAGHSRGGGSSFLAMREHAEALGVIALQSIHLGAFGFGPGPLDDFPVLGMTAGRDVDLNYPRVEVIEDQLSGVYSWVNINGGIHAYTADRVPLEFDDRPAISRGQQHDITELYTTAFFLSLSGSHRHARLARRARQILYTPAGQRITGEKISRAGVYQRWRPPGERLQVDDFDSAVEDDSTERNDLGGDNSVQGFVLAEEAPTYRPWGDETFRYDFAYSLLLHATSPGTYTLSFGEPHDVSATPRLEMRARRPDNAVLALLFEVDIVAAGELTTFDAWNHRGSLPIDDRFQQIVIDLSATGLDLTAVEEVRLRVGGGMLQIDDLVFAGGP